MHFYLGMAFHHQKKLEEAATAYRKTIDLKPDLAEAYSALGNTLRDQKKLEEAVTACRKAIDLKPNFAEAYNNLSIALHDQAEARGGGGGMPQSHSTSSRISLSRIVTLASY